jgi:2,3-bisphosphoglycerate-dependent phosphoglycerate mutase
LRRIVGESELRIPPICWEPTRVCVAVFSIGALPSAAVEIVMVRHGQPQWIRDGLCVVDPILTETGFAQADHLAPALADEHFDEFFVSPLVRAGQTAAPLAKRLDRTPTVVQWLEECREPDWHGEPAEIATNAYKNEAGYHHDQRWEGLPGGESLRDFTTRIHAGLTDFLAERGITRVPDVELPVWHIDAPGRRILWVAHAGTNAVATSHLLGLTPVPWEWDRFRLGHASINRLRAIPVGKYFTFSVTRLSDVEHLPLDLRTI